MGVHFVLRMLISASLENKIDLSLFPICMEEDAVLFWSLQHYPFIFPPFFPAGGTSVTKSLQCPVEEKRMIASLDMSQMVRSHYWRTCMYMYINAELKVN